MSLSLKTPQLLDSSFENVPTFWDVDFGFGPENPLEIFQDVRPTVRTFCFDENGMISAVQGKHNHNNYYVPGGGVDDGESLVDAAKREALEESGDEIDDLVPVMRYLNRHQPNGKLYDIYIFTARIIKKGDPTTTQENELGKSVEYMIPEHFSELSQKQFDENNLDTQAYVTKYVLDNFIIKK